MEILHLDNNHPLLEKQLEEAGHNNTKAYQASREEVLKIINSYHGVVVRSRITIDQEFIEAASKLKFIARVGAGLESIDLQAAQARNIVLIAAPEGNSNAVGEHAMGLLLALTNKIPQASQNVKQGNWNREAHRGMELEGKTVGLIGYGNMGKAFAKKLSGFNCEVICYDILPNVGDSYATQVDLNTFKAQLDVLSLHTPWTPLTHKMIDATFIASVAKPFYLINTARGKSVVTKDLVSGLKTAKVLGAGLDVLEYEKSSFESLFKQDQIPEDLKALMAMEQVILTPHVAGWTMESKIKLAQTIVDKILAL